MPSFAKALIVLSDTDKYWKVLAEIEDQSGEAVLCPFLFKIKIFMPGK